jgi:hypothetical protein
VRSAARRRGTWWRSVVDDPEERHGLADFLEGKLSELRAEWEAGSFRALQQAFVWCAGNGYKFPEWLREAILDELAFSKANRPRGGTKTGNSAAAERYERIHRLRYLLMDQHLKFQQYDIESGRRTTPISEIEAARSVQDTLGGKHFAWGTADAIRKSYKSLKSG